VEVDLGLISDLVSTPLSSPEPSVQGSRHRGPTGHVHTPTGHIKGDLHRRRQADKASSSMALNALEGPFTDAMRKLFARQERATLTRLTGKRGRRMLRQAGTRQQPGQPPPPGPQGPQGQAPLPAAVTPLGQPVPPSASAVFDTTYWTAQLADELARQYQAAQDAAVRRVQDQVTRGNPDALEGLDDSGSLAATTQILRTRANQMAADVTQTTFDQIADQLAQGFAAGENINQMAERVRHVFHNAGAVRALTIARTESHGAMNQAAQTYAQNLPASVVSRKEWLAHHDERTRPTHRVADGQQQPVGQPYVVGQALMMFPGDPTGPPGEVINCRCGQAFLPPENPFSSGAAP
jgi:SPP1 gp7 family putative phage head morphogenesis protein